MSSKFAATTGFYDNLCPRSNLLSLHNVKLNFLDSFSQKSSLSKLVIGQLVDSKWFYIDFICLLVNIRNSANLSCVTASRFKAFWRCFTMREVSIEAILLGSMCRGIPWVITWHTRDCAHWRTLVCASSSRGAHKWLLATWIVVKALVLVTLSRKISIFVGTICRKSYATDDCCSSVKLHSRSLWFLCMLVFLVYKASGADKFWKLWGIITESQCLDLLFSSIKSFGYGDTFDLFLLWNSPGDWTCRWWRAFWSW